MSSSINDRLWVRVQFAFWVSVASVFILKNEPRLLLYNYRTARAYPLRHRSSLYWAWRCAGHHMKIDGFLAERFKVEMAMHGMAPDDDGGQLVSR